MYVDGKEMLDVSNSSEHFPSTEREFFTKSSRALKVQSWRVRGAKVYKFQLVYFDVLLHESCIWWENFLRSLSVGLELVWWRGNSLENCADNNF